MTFPESVAVYPEDGPKSVDITSKTRFTWDPTDACLGTDSRTVPEDLESHAATGMFDGVREIRIGEWSKKFDRLPALPEGMLNTLRTVKINSAKLTDWSGVYALDQVTSLEVGEKVSVLPDGIGAMSSLQTLVIRGKRLKLLPADLTQLSKLTSLTIINAGVTLPEDLGTLPLEKLRLTWTKKIKVLPESLGSCTTLRFLETDSVPLKALPDGIYRLPKLERLVLLLSKISKLGGAIDWPALQELDLDASYRKWPAQVAIPVLEKANLGGKFAVLPDLFVPTLRKCWVQAPLKTIDPRLASLVQYRETNYKLGVKLTATQAAWDALSADEQAAFGNYVKIV